MVSILKGLENGVPSFTNCYYCQNLYLYEFYFGSDACENNKSFYWSLLFMISLSTVSHQNGVQKNDGQWIGDGETETQAKEQY